MRDENNSEHNLMPNVVAVNLSVICDGYYVACKPIRLLCISFMFIKIKFSHYHSCVMFAMKSMSILQ